MIRDLIGDGATDQLLENLEPVVEGFRRLGWNELKPWSEFCASFKPPQLNAKHLEQRVATNFLYYRTNYAYVCACILGMRLLLSPMIIFTAAAIFGVWFYLLTVYARPLVIGDIILDNTGKQWLCVVISFLILLGTGTVERLLWSAFYCAVLCGGHMLFRPRNVSSKANKYYEEARLSGYDGFFNSPAFESKQIDSKEVDIESDVYDSKYTDANIRRRPVSMQGGSGKYSE